jgi:hypothetical protein
MLLVEQVEEEVEKDLEVVDLMGQQTLVEVVEVLEEINLSVVLVVLEL